VVQNCTEKSKKKNQRKSKLTKTEKHNSYNRHKRCTKCTQTQIYQGKARVVTIVVLIILAGITLNAVIGQDGIIFQAKDTKNMVANETQYDNQQLAQLQDELKDNQLYSGIGIIPGTDIGGPSEGGEQGNSHGGGNQGGTGTNTGGSGGTNTNENISTGKPVTNQNQGGGQVSGETAQDPTIKVLEGEEVAAAFYRSDVTIQIFTQDKTQKIKYVLTSTVDAINNELYPSGLIRELDIENGGTLTLTKDGEYTITAYAYDTEGNKSNATVMWLKKAEEITLENGIDLQIASGNMGENGWYTSNITIRVLATDNGSSRVTYRVRGKTYSNGVIGNLEFDAGQNIDTQEVDIGNGTTFKIMVDGDFQIVAYTYDAGGMRISTAETVYLKRDASRPIITLYKGEQVVGTGFQISMGAQDLASNLADTKRYTYRHKLATDTEYIDEDSQETTKMYSGLQQDKTYDMYMVIRDNAGNMTSSDIVSKPALWVSNTPTLGDTVNGGNEGNRRYYSTDVDISLTGQDRNNVDISKVTYQILGTTTGAGVMDGINYDKGVALPEDEKECGNNKTIQIRADGNWIIKVHTYNKERIKVTTNMYEVTRDTVTPESPVIEVASGTMGDETYYRSDIDVRLTSQDDTCYKKTTYVVTGTATGNGSIGGVSITSGQNVNIAETDIANGGTFRIQVDGRWTIKGYTYDKAGRKSVIATGITITRDTVDPVANTPQITAGTVGEPSYYRSNVTVKISGSDVTSPLKKVTYRVTGTARGANGNGIVANTTVTENQTIDTGEVEIANNGTIQIQADGVWTVTAYTYDVSGRKSAVSGSLIFTRDTVKPIISSFTIDILTYGATGNGTAIVEASDEFSGVGTESTTYNYYLASTSKGTSANNTYEYTEIDADNMPKVTVKDKAGNISDEKTLTKISQIDFGYIGSIQSVKIPLSGRYKLEVWGAQGSTQGNTYKGILYGAGYGGYTVGNIGLNSEDALYIGVGGKGTYNKTKTKKVNSVVCYLNGGYNGGGNTTTSSQNGGGGATHIARSSGILSEFETKIDDVLIVAGGGGGCSAYSLPSSWKKYIGHGGGYVGGVGVASQSYNKSTIAFGGNQTDGGNGGGNTTAMKKLPYKGSFGQGGAGYTNSSGGGGGYYGGGGGYGTTSGNSTDGYTYQYGKGAGGSGYFSTAVSEGCMYTYSTLNISTETATLTNSTTNVSDDAISEYAKKGHGYARITLIE